MARGRVIDKQIHSNEELAQCQIEARYLYTGMIIHADDEGRMKASPNFLKVVIFPFDEAIRVDTVKRWRDQLASIGVIKLYAAGGKEYLSHPNWDKWQPLRKDRARPSDCPPDGEQVTTNCQPLVDACPPIPNPTVPNPTEPNKDSVRPKRTLFIKPLAKEIEEYCFERKNSVDPQAFFDHYESKGWLVGKVPMKDWRAAVRTWEKNTIAFHGVNPAVQPKVNVDPKKFAEAEARAEEMREREWQRRQAAKAPKVTEEMASA